MKSHKSYSWLTKNTSSSWTSCFHVQCLCPAGLVAALLLAYGSPSHGQQLAFAAFWLPALRGKTLNICTGLKAALESFPYEEAALAGICGPSPMEGCKSFAVENEKPCWHEGGSISFALKSLSYFCCGMWNQSFLTWEPRKLKRQHRPPQKKEVLTSLSLFTKENTRFHFFLYM